MRRTDAGDEIDKMHAVVSRSQTITREDARGLLRRRVRELVGEELHFKKAVDASARMGRAADEIAWGFIDAPPTSMAGGVALLRYSHEFIHPCSVFPLDGDEPVRTREWE